MHFNTYGGNAALLAAALANLDDDADYEHVERVLSQHLVARFQLSGTQIVELRTWWGRLRDAFAARTTADKIDIVNPLLAATAAHPFISTHDGQPPHLHYAAEDADVVTRVKATTAAGLAMVLAEARNGSAGAPRHAATWCSSTCRAAAAAPTARPPAPPASTSPRTAPARDR